MITRRHLMLVVVALGLTAMAGGAPRPAQAEDVIKIGVVGPLTGGQSKMGNDVLNGATLAVEEWNAKGGVLGKKIVIVKRDDEAKPDLAVAAARELANEKVVGVIGHFNSSCTIPASNVYNEGKIVMITPSATNPQVTDRGYPGIFRVCGRDDAQGKVGAAYAVKVLKVNKVAIVHDKTTYGQGLADEFQKSFRELNPQGEVVFYGGVAREQVDFKAILTTIKEKSPELWYFGGIYDQAGPMKLQGDDVGLTAKFMSGDGTIDQEFIKTAGKAAEGAFLTFAPDSKKIATAKAFNEKYAEQYGETGPYSVYAYDAAQMLIAGIAKAGSADGAAVAKAIHELSYEGAIGKISFNEKGDIQGSFYVVWVVKDGEFQVSEQQ